MDGEYEPSPYDPIAQQVELYESTGGAQGRTMQGAPCVILTTRGRKTGKLRKAPLIRVSDDDGRYAVVASLGGAPQHPVWYLNLQADPEVTLQDGPDVVELRARELTGDEKAEWWARATQVWPDYDGYQAKTEREIPILVLEPR